LTQAQVALPPGSSSGNFGAEHVRLSFAISPPEIRIGLDRIENNPAQTNPPSQEKDQRGFRNDTRD
jgi:aspartate/methionine/tyrosine aminotransferase